MLAALPTTSVQTDAFACEGGWDLATPPLSLKAGKVTDALNFVSAPAGGYQRIAGYERFDGHDSPSTKSDSHAVLEVGGSPSPALLSTITGASSAATGTLIYSTGSRYVVSMLSGSYTVGENLFVGTTFVGRFSTWATPTGAEVAQYKQKVANYWRTFVGAVPGSGPVRGAWVFKGEVYAFRNNSGGTACVMHKATASGWSAVTTPALAPNGNYEFVNYNFGGATGTFAMYGACGVHKAFKFDGTTLTLITTGMSADTPSHITAHRNHLFLSFGPSVQHSPIGDPTGAWTPVYGAGEIALGDDVTGLVPAIGNQDTSALLIATRNKLYILYGTSALTWSLASLAGDSGAMPGTLQKIGDLLMLDERGVATLTTSANYGNFVGGTLTENILEWVKTRRMKSTGSCVSNEANQYRLFFNDMYALYVTLRRSKSPEIMPVQLKHVVRCVCSGELADGSEATYFGSDDGYVYQLDKGSSFDGESIPYSLTFAYTNSKAPRVLKRYRKLAIELTGPSYSEFNVSYSLGYGDARTAQPGKTLVDGSGLTAPNWDALTWDSFFWDGRSILPSEVSMDGTADNFALLISGESDAFYPFTLTSVIFHYTPRRRMR